MIKRAIERFSKDIVRYGIVLINANEIKLQKHVVQATAYVRNCADMHTQLHHT